MYCSSVPVEVEEKIYDKLVIKASFEHCSYLKKYVRKVKNSTSIGGPIA